MYACLIRILNSRSAKSGLTLSLDNPQVSARPVIVRCQPKLNPAFLDVQYIGSV